MIPVLSLFSSERASFCAVDYLLRGAIAFSLLYPAITAIFDPYSWIGFFPDFVVTLPVSDLVLLHSFGSMEAVLALWILSGWRVAWPATAAALLFVSIVIFNSAQFSVVFRDLALAAAAGALAMMHVCRPDQAGVPSSERHNMRQA